MITTRPERVFHTIVDPGYPDLTYTVPPGCTLEITAITAVANFPTEGSGADLVWLTVGGIDLWFFQPEDQYQTQPLLAGPLLVKGGETVILNVDLYTVNIIIQVNGTLYGYDWTAD